MHRINNQQDRVWEESVKHSIRSWSAAIAALTLLHAAPAASQDAKPAQPPPPPCSSPEHHQFDFWIGSWEVHNAAGKLAGTNDVHRILGECVIQENWKGAGGGEGKSFNIYSAADHKWYQTWVDAQGLILRLAGGIEDGKMVLSGETMTPKGKVLDSISWEALEDGRVRQHWRRSSDQGKTWSDVFDGYYSKREE